MKKIVNLLNINGTFGLCFVLIGIIIQIVTYMFSDDALLSLISGIAGIIAVVLCSQRKFSFYFWALLQMFTFMFICYQQQLYGKILENWFYFITMIYGIFVWKNNIEDNIIKTRKLTIIQWVDILITLISGTALLYISLLIINGTSPFIDSLTTALAFIAQILMILRYKESWYFWLVVDIICVILFISINNYCMTIQYIFWTINCFYGLKMWSNN